jgi:hypothetical protein
MAQTETQPVAVIDSSLENREDLARADLLSVVREFKAILKEAIAILS